MADLPKSLGRIGIDSHEKALLVAPASYRDCTEYISVLPVPDTGIEQYVRLTIESMRFMTNDRRVVAPESKAVAFVVGLLVDELGDEAGFVTRTRLSMWRKAIVGQTIDLYGELVTWKNTREFKDPYILNEDEAGRALPVYKGRQGLTSADAVHKGVMMSRHAIGAGAKLLLEKISFSAEQFRDITGISAEQMLADIHWPTDMQCATRALAAARDVSLRSVSAQVKNSRQKPLHPESAIDIKIEDIRRLVSQIPFPLTYDQRKAIWEIVQDLVSSYPMNRILSGDVGTGKTLTFMLPAVAAYLRGASVAIIAPGKLLVRQLAKELREYFPDIPVGEVVSGEALPDKGIVIGTTAVTIAAQAGNRTFDLVITDEQHKFSVAQRKVLLSACSNLLESTATAIPRTVALVSMGGMDVSMLKECPVQKDIMSRIISRKKQSGLFEFIKQQIKEGGQVAIIYPLVESEKTESTVAAALDRFAKTFGDRVGIIHGRQKGDVKDETIRKMLAREIDVLLSSTVIEVGLTLPSLKVMVVINPENFGASQLHQLRGRLARKGGKGYFFMFLKDNASPKPETLQRLQLLVECSDGFELSARDAQLRGAGEVFDELGNQSGSTRSIFYGIDLTYSDLERAVLDALTQVNTTPAQRVVA